jgi:taurine dioxygenase
VFDKVRECPEVTIIEQKGEQGIYNDEWHTDVTFRAMPALASILYGRVIPPVGGDTLWSSMYAAYDALSAPMRRLVDGLSAVHDITEGFGDIVSAKDGLAKLRAMQEKFPPVAHPVVRTHPVTGRRALFVNRSFTTRLLGVTKIESEHLLEMLLRHAEQSSFQVRFRWQPNSIAMWDNRCTQHYAANDFSPHHRLMHRVTVVGDAPYFVA